MTKFRARSLLIVQYSATAVEASGTAVAHTVAPQAVGHPTRSKKVPDAGVNAIVNTGPTPAVKRPRRSKK